MDELQTQVRKIFQGALIGYAVLAGIVFLIIEGTFVYSYLCHGRRMKDLEAVAGGLVMFVLAALVLSLFAQATRVRRTASAEEIEAARVKLRGPRKDA